MNHPLLIEYGFYDELKEKNYSLRLWKFFNYLFNYLPIGALIGEKIFCIHGGLSHHLSNL